MKLKALCKKRLTCFKSRTWHNMKREIRSLYFSLWSHLDASLSAFPAPVSMITFVEGLFFAILLSAASLSSSSAEASRSRSASLLRSSTTTTPARLNREDWRRRGRGRPRPRDDDMAGRTAGGQGKTPKYAELQTCSLHSTIVALCIRLQMMK